MDRVRKLWAIGRIRFRSVVFGWRSGAAAVLIGIYVISSVQPCADFCRDMGERAAPWIFPFMASDSIHQLFFMLGAVALFADAPFRDRIYPYVVSRAGRGALAAGNLLGMAFAAACYVLFLMGMSVLPLAGCLMWDTQWGRVWNTLSVYMNEYAYDWSFEIDRAVYVGYAPLEAMGLCFLLQTGCTLIIGMVEYIGNLVSGRTLGIGLAAGVVLLDVTIYNMFPFGWFAFSPVSLTQLSNYIRTDYMLMTGSPMWGMLYYGLLLVGLYALIWLREKRGE